MSKKKPKTKRAKRGAARRKPNRQPDPWVHDGDTDALNEQKELNLTTEESWWQDILQEGKVLARQETWESEVVKQELLIDYTNFAQRFSGSFMNKCSMHRLTKFLKRMLPLGFPGVKTVRVSPQPGASYNTGLQFCTNPRCYVLPTLEVCRTSWNAKMGFKTVWQDVEEPIDQPVF